MLREKPRFELRNGAELAAGPKLLEAVCAASGMAADHPTAVRVTAVFDLWLRSDIADRAELLRSELAATFVGHLLTACAHALPGHRVFYARV